MSFIKICSVAAIVLAGSISFAAAREATEAEMKMLGEAVQVYKTATEKGDVDGVLAKAMSARMFTETAAFSKTFGEEATVEDLRAQTRDVLVQMSKHIVISDVDIVLEKAQARELDDGTPYFIMPYAYTVKSGTQKKRISQDMIAVLDDGQWYLITVSNPRQKAVLGKAYPGLDKLGIKKPLVTPAD
ncbi:MAG: Hypothetical protein BHV28_05050 [Candidatus Tokpelaia hoelldobleri]|uniref:Uncharacterized protein n=1 Tax=Candidatus Tokpelaia hoelldobleri TaxID=1902579 RepID=A0A1U9JTM7_9HYPH|nr:MAG: Hypothetical protein BHV28_05050 [Candidatus Tokpelaia hoelldoblerii]